ncbi:MAG: HEPN domain-containing protein, partial [Proteobacteria bacterium]|nr:HEPN domain-containing protein [Pseudomonadota bacterium]
DFPYTHNISRLIELCGELAADWTGTILDAEELTSFAITARYPGQHTEVTREEALRAIEISAAVRKTVRGALRGHGLAFPDSAPGEP